MNYSYLISMKETDEKKIRTNNKLEHGLTTHWNVERSRFEGEKKKELQLLCREGRESSDNCAYAELKLLRGA